MVAIAAKFLSDRYGAPAMLMALLLGIAFHFLSEEGKCMVGIEFAAKKVLRTGVALLGVRVSVSLLIGLGFSTIALLVLAVLATIAFGLLAARLFGRGWRLALITSGSVAICGVSAAMAIAAVLPKNRFSGRNLIFTVISVTVLSTITMIFYLLWSRRWGSTTALPEYSWAAPSMMSRRLWVPVFRSRRKQAGSPRWSS